GVLGIGDTFSRRAILQVRDHWSVSITFLRMIVGRTDMKFDSRSGNRRSRGQFSPSAPVIVESLEKRTLLAAPQILSPTGTITDSTPTVTWQAVDTATNYDLWISDVETRQQLVLQQGLTTLSYTVPTELNVGRLRIWARANFGDGSTTGWGTPTDVVLQVAPTITGPVNTTKPMTPRKIDTFNPTVTWTSPPGARSFEVLLSNQTERTSKSYRVTNLTPLLDASGNTIPDGKGDVVREEIRSFEIPDDLTLGQYRIFMRTTDDAGRVSANTAGYDLDVAPEVTITRPSGPVFQDVQVVTVSISGAPTTGSYTLAFSVWNLGQSTGTYRTSALLYNATGDQVQAAVRALPGFGAAVVTTTGTTPNLTHKIALNGMTRPVTVVSTQTVSPGTVTASTFRAQGILLEWEAIPGATHYEVFVARRGAANESTPIYNPQYLTTTSYRLPSLLSPGEYVFWVRARRLHQVTQVALAGTPTSGTYKLTFASPATTASGSLTTTKITTGPIPVGATAAAVQTAIRNLSGYEKVVVTSSGTSPNLTYQLQIPQFKGPVTVTAVSSISPGTVTVTSTNVPETIGIWSARSDFATIQAPVVSAPVGVGSDPAVKLVTDPRPTIEWTAIDGTARYELWIDRTASSSIYLQTDVSTNSYTPSTDLPAGNYWVWVRAISTTGTVTPWSSPYKFTATGGRPLITSPVDNQTSIALPMLTWVGVTNAVSYDIQIAWIGTDFNYIERTGITTTNYTLENPLNSGSYRLWIRAVMADGTKLPWSTPVTFIVAEVSDEPQQDESDVLKISTMLVSLPSVSNNGNSQTSQHRDEKTPVAEHQVAENSAEAPVQPQAETIAATVESDSAGAGQTDLISQLAEACVDTEWWSAPEHS
ncbi:MAG: hypothetical protein ACK58L_02970, partial [Planctomycetota bacterium]